MTFRMRRASNRWIQLYPLLITFILMVILCNDLIWADGPKESKGQSIAPLVVHRKGEQLVDALATTNHAPRLFGQGFRRPFFPKNFDWNEYARVRSAIKDLEANAEDVWPSIVEHITDSEYCFTVEVVDSAYNYTVGDVCYTLVKNWLRRGCPGTMAMDSDSYWFVAPGFMKPPELRDWCRARRDKKLYEMQIEVAEWAISIIPEKSKMPKVIQDEAITSIKERITELQETKKAVRGKFFVTDAICPCAEDDAERFRMMDKPEKP